MKWKVASLTFDRKEEIISIGANIADTTLLDSSAVERVLPIPEGLTARSQRKSAGEVRKGSVYFEHSSIAQR